MLPLQSPFAPAASQLVDRPAAVFGTIRPVTSMVEVSRLIDPALLVEIEADALVP